MSIWSNLTDLFKDGDDIAGEMVKKYRGTILAIKNAKQVVYARYRGCNDFHVFHDANDIELKLTHDTSCEVTIPQLDRGLYNTSKGAVYVKRNPFRQYKKGLSKDTHHITSISQYAFNSPNADLYNYFDTFAYEALLNKDNECDLDAAFEGLEKYGAVAMNRQFALALSHRTATQDPYLWMNCYPIGTVNRENRTITVLNQTFLQEILDTRYKWCPNYVVR